jgi:hypothetical protein
VNEQEQKQFIERLIQRLKDTHHLTVIYSVAIQFAKDYGVPSIDEILEAARKSPEILAESEKQFASLDEQIGPALEAAQSKEVCEWLQQWKSSGKPN